MLWAKLKYLLICIDCLLDTNPVGRRWRRHWILRCKQCREWTKKYIPYQDSRCEEGKLLWGVAHESKNSGEWLNESKN